MVEQVGDGEEGLSAFQPGIFGNCHRKQLVQRVDLQELDAGVGKDLLSGDSLEGFCQHAVGAGVAVVVRGAKQGTMLIEKSKIHAPGVYAQAMDWL
ncbi:MAG: hypothetical protein MUC85_11670 [Anaerolineales bacterium]|nr:hypothetical protein [Anaerolineales bacterium]